MSLRHYEDWYGSLFVISLAVGVLLFVIYALVVAFRHFTNLMPF